MTQQQSRIISTVLSPACRVWLRSQVSQVEDLQVNIQGGDRQIFKGYIPRVFISAHRAVYQGIHLSQIQLVAENIRINLGQVLKGKPLRLLEPVPVSGELRLLEADFQASLASPLLSTALTDLLRMLLPSAAINHPTEALNINWQQVAFDTDRFTLAGELVNPNNTTPVTIRSGLQLASTHELRLAPLDVQTSLASSLGNLDNFQVDLGSEVDIQELTLIPGQLICRGQLRVMP